MLVKRSRRHYSIKNADGWRLVERVLAIRNNAGYTALQIAIDHGHTQCAHMVETTARKYQETHSNMSQSRSMMVAGGGAQLIRHRSVGSFDSLMLEQHGDEMGLCDDDSDSSGENDNHDLGQQRRRRRRSPIMHRLRQLIRSRYNSSGPGATRRTVDHLFSRIG